LLVKDSAPTSTPLTVAINAQIDPGHAGGIETALQALFAQLAVQSRDERFLLLSTARHAPELRRLTGRNQHVLDWPFPQKAQASFRRMTRRWLGLRDQAGRLAPGVDAAHWGWWHARRLLAPAPSTARSDVLLREQGVDVAHFPYPIRFESELPFIYEPWDLQHRHFPAFFSDAERRWRDSMYREGCERARIVVTATAWTKRDLVEQYGIDPRKVAVVPRGPWAAPLMPSAADVERVRAAYRLPERFALYPAMAFPHKNHLRLFEALAILRDRHGIVLPLVCTGRPYEPHAAAIAAAIARFRLGDQVRMLGLVPTDDLHALYRSAWALVFPSLFEGLGLPILEAFQYDLPVLASDATCLPEVAGDAALLFDATRPEAIAAALLAAHRDPSILDRCRRAAPARLARFSWPRAAATFLACYHAAAGRPLSQEQANLLEEATTT